MDNKIAFGWNSATHSYITKKAYTTVRKNIKIPFKKKILITYSKMPDIDQTYNLNEWHFFDPFAKYFKKEKNAQILFEKHINKAFKRWEENKPKKTAKNLGRALHYLQDVFMPMHAQKLNATEKIAQVKSHTTFENKAQVAQEELLKDIKIKPFNENIPFNDYISNLIKTKAIESKQKLKDAFSTDILIQSKAIETSIRDAFDTSYELIYRFVKEIN